MSLKNMKGVAQAALPDEAVATPATDGEGIVPPAQLTKLSGQATTGGLEHPAEQTTVTLNEPTVLLPQLSMAV